MDPQSCKFCFWDTLCIVKVPVALVVPSEKKSSALPSTMFNHTAWWVFKNKFIHLLIWQKEIRKVFFLEPRHCRLSLLTTPTLIWRHKHSLNVYNTTAWLRMKCLNTPAHSCSERITEGGEGRPPCTCSPLLTFLRRELPKAGNAGCERRQESGQAAVPTHLPGTATPEHHLRNATRAPLPQLLTRREIKVSRGREHTWTPAPA